MVEVNLRSVAEAFWAEVGQPEPYPRSLEVPLLWALPLTVSRTQNLSVSSVEGWLRRRRVPFGLGCHDRSLRACLVSYGGKGLVLLDANDPEDELRFSLAHEASHFLLDYLLPRRRAIDSFGARITEVLDGRRFPTVEERVDALLSNVPVGVHTHLMERNLAGVIGKSAVLEIESRADSLALELLAPEEEVRCRVPAFQDFEQAAGRTVSVLLDEFGLPPRIADGYGFSLCRSWYGGPSFNEWLGI